MAKEAQSTMGSQPVSETLSQGSIEDSETAAMAPAMHTFPLAEEQARVLDEAKEEIEHPRPLRSPALSPLGFVALAASIGLLLVLLGKARRRAAKVVQPKLIQGGLYKRSSLFAQRP